MNFRNYKNQILIGCAIILLSIYGWVTKPEVKEKEPIHSLKQEDTSLKKPQGKMMCHITGEIVKPGVYEFNEGDRLKDVIDLAGGFTKDAYLEDVNLSIKIVDEMKIKIQNKNKVNQVANQEQNNITTTDSSTSNKININKAELNQLMELQGIGESKAKKIIETREQASFKTIEDLMNVPGIGQKTFDNLKDKISVY